MQVNAAGKCLKKGGGRGRERKRPLQDQPNCFKQRDFRSHTPGISIQLTGFAKLV